MDQHQRERDPHPQQTRVDSHPNITAAVVNSETIDVLRQDFNLKVDELVYAMVTREWFDFVRLLRQLSGVSVELAAALEAIIREHAS